MRKPSFAAKIYCKSSAAVRYPRGVFSKALRAGASQEALRADKNKTRMRGSLIAPSRKRSGMRIRMKNNAVGLVFHTAACAAGVAKQYLRQSEDRVRDPSALLDGKRLRNGDYHALFS